MSADIFYRIQEAIVELDKEAAFYRKINADEMHAGGSRKAEQAFDLAFAYSAAAHRLRCLLREV
uniref:hypothetical protein n=1 Tax=Metallibacterium scheffleri TaxID=993689 RepID=UPI0023F4E2F8